MESITLTPAYGRIYKNKDQVLKDWNDGKDFIGHHPILGSAYTSKNDLPKEIEVVEFRYGKMLGSIFCLEV